MRISLRYKFFGIMLLLLTMSIVTYLILATRLFNNDKEAYIYSESSANATTLSTEANSTFGSIIRSLRLIATTHNSSLDNDEKDKVIQTLFDDDANLIQVTLSNLVTNSTRNIDPNSARSLVRSSYFEPLDVKPTILGGIIVDHPIEVALVHKETVVIEKVFATDALGFLRISVYIADRNVAEKDQIITAIVRMDPFLDLLSRSSLYGSTLINRYGTPLVSPSDEVRATFDDKTFQQTMGDVTQGIAAQGVRLALTSEKREFVVSWSRLFYGNLFVVTQIPKDKAFLASKKLIDTSILFAAMILVISIMMSKLFTDRMTRTLKTLYEATKKIAQGDFTIKVPVKSKDEIGSLTTSFNTMAGEITRLMAETAEKARMEKELETAFLVQETFFPEADVDTSKLTISSFFKTASECGGDWWGHFPIGERYHVICIGDATGHGVPAALVTAIAYSVCNTIDQMRKESTVAPPPDAILDRLNEVLFRSLRGTIWMTFFVGLIDLETLEFHFANAGHNMPYVIPKDPDDERFKGNKTKKWISLVARGVPLGQKLDNTYQAKSIQLSKGDRLFMYTDGLIECKNQSDEEYSKRKLQHSLRDNLQLSATNLRDNVIKEAFNFFGKQPLDDDVTLVVAEVK